MSDIVELLRSQKWSTGVTINRYADEAALEIERLREEIAALKRDIAYGAEVIDQRNRMVERLERDLAESKK